MAQRSEVPYDPTLRAPRGLTVGTQLRPTMLSALMQCGPFEDPELSAEELLPLRDILQNAIERLDERSQWVFNAYVVERQSLREIGRDLQLSKTQVARIKDEAIKQLGIMLKYRLEIQEYLNR